MKYQNSSMGICWYFDDKFSNNFTVNFYGLNIRTVIASQKFSILEQHSKLMVKK